MSPELQQYYENRLSMMSSKAWHQLIEDLQGLLEQYSNIRNCDKDSIEFRRGQVDILDYIISLKDVSEKAYEELNEKNL